MGFCRFFVLFLTFTVTAAAELPSQKILDRYRQMLSANPVEGTALERLWKAYSEAGQTAQLLALYRDEGTFASEMVLGHLLRRSGQSEDARPAYERAAKLDPRSPLPLLALARMDKEAGKLAAAAGLFEKASALLPEGDPQQPETLFEAGQAWISGGDVTRGAAAWEKAVAHAPGNTDLRRRLADSYVVN
ncbi:MAG: tetratricopeptide repeat protein, partial [Verrucomicrobiaceae bacterium]